MAVQGSSLGAIAMGSAEKTDRYVARPIISSGVEKVGPALEVIQERVMAGMVEDYLFRTRSFKDKGYVLSDRESELLAEFTRNLYLEALGREPRQWAVDLWELYVSYLLETLRIEMNQALWDVALIFFGSEEYVTKNKGMEAVLTDAFRGLLGRDGTPEEKTCLLEREFATGQLLHEIAASQEFLLMIQGAFSGVGYDSISATIAEIYIVMLDRLSLAEELNGIVWSHLEPDAYYDAIDSLVRELADSDEFKAVAATPEHASWRIGRALKR